MQCDNRWRDVASVPRRGQPPVIDWKRHRMVATMLADYGVSLAWHSDDAVLAAYKELFTRTGLHPVDAWQQWRAGQERRRPSWPRSASSRASSCRSAR